MKITDETKKKKTKTKRKTKEQKEKLSAVFIPLLLKKLNKK